MKNFFILLKNQNKPKHFHGYVNAFSEILTRFDAAIFMNT